MGSFAAFVVIDDDGGAEFFSGRMGAETVVTDAVMAGPAGTVAWARSQERGRGSAIAESERAVWMQGGLLIDAPRRRVIWTQDGEGILPRIGNALLEHAWPGWTALWSPEGMSGLVRLAGGDPGTFTVEGSTTRGRSPCDDPWFTPGGEQFVGAPLSVRLDDDDIVLWRTDADLWSLAGCRPDEVAQIAHRARDDVGVRGEGWGERWLLIDPEDGRAQRPDTGFHVDLTMRTLSWWTTVTSCFPAREFAAQWPGWTARAWGDAFEEHERVLGGSALRPPWSGELAVAAHQLTGARAASSRMTVVLDVLAAMSRLRPARFVDSEGEIHAW